MLYSFSTDKFRKSGRVDFLSSDLLTEQFSDNSSPSFIEYKQCSTPHIPLRQQAPATFFSHNKEWREEKRTGERGKYIPTQKTHTQKPLTGSAVTGGHRQVWLWQTFPWLANGHCGSSGRVRQCGRRVGQWGDVWLKEEGSVLVEELEDAWWRVAVDFLGHWSNLEGCSVTKQQNNEIRMVRCKQQRQTSALNADNMTVQWSWTKPEVNFAKSFHQKFSVQYKLLSNQNSTAIIAQPAFCSQLHPINLRL